MFKEQEHPRDENGQFVSKESENKPMPKFNVRQKHFLDEINKYNLNFDDAWGEIVNNRYKYQYVNELDEVLKYVFNESATDPFYKDDEEREKEKASKYLGVKID